MRLPWILVLAAMAGCDSPHSPDPADGYAVRPGLDEPFALKVGDRARLEGANLAIRFLDVPSDSRCPSHALILCFWEGDGAAEVEIGPLTGVGLIDTLHTSLQPQSVPLGGVTLVLERLDPYPEDVTPIPLGEYIATFVVERPR